MGRILVPLCQIHADNLAAELIADTAPDIGERQNFALLHGAARPVLPHRRQRAPAFFFIGKTRAAEIIVKIMKIMKVMKLMETARAAKATGATAPSPPEGKHRTSGRGQDRRAHQYRQDFSTTSLHAPILDPAA